MIVYSDVDGTLVGPGGCFFRAEDASVTLEPALALAELLRAGVTLVLVSGRTGAQLLEACHLLGADGYVAELGAVVGYDRGRSVDYVRGAVPADVAGSGCAPDELVEALCAAHRGWLEWHDPWHVGHEVDAMLRGTVDVDAVEGWLASRGFPWLRLLDNGVLPAERPTGLHPAATPVHVYHLMPAGLGKGRAVAADLRRRGLTASDAVAIGDSVSDVEMADQVARMWLVANGARQRGMAERVAARANVTVTTRPLGLGWAEAVRALLADRPD